MDPILHHLLVQARRQQLIRSKGRISYPKMPAARYPILTERKYAAWIMRLLQPLAQVSNAWAKETYPKVLSAYQKQDSADLHQDADSHGLILSLTASLEQVQTEMDLGAGGAAASSVMTTAQAVNSHVAQRFAMERKIALGNVYQVSEPWVQSSLTEWVETNRKLIKSLGLEAQTKMEAMVLEAVQTGVRPEDLVARVYNLNRSTGISRAKLIAADQVGKLTGLLTEKRAMAVGMDTYTWQTAMDERVRGRPGGLYPTARPSHWSCQGKVGIFGNGSVWVVNGQKVPRGANEPATAPGMEIRCRCIAASRWEDVFKPIDEELLADPYVLAEMGKGPWPGA